MELDQVDLYRYKQAGYINTRHDQTAYWAARLSAFTDFERGLARFDNIPDIQWFYFNHMYIGTPDDYLYYIINTAKRALTHDNAVWPPQDYELWLTVLNEAQANVPRLTRAHPPQRRKRIQHH